MREEFHPSDSPIGVPEGAKQPMTKYRNSVKIRLSDETLEKLNQMSETLGLPVSTCARMLLRVVLEAGEDEIIPRMLRTMSRERG
ncbi:MAG: hypothetical protein ACFFGZ_19500 [Candidatus Thorarchaeota archaeon]